MLPHRLLQSPLRLLVVILLTTLALARPSIAQQDLPSNPLIRQGVLANGLRYTVVRHPAAPGAPPRVALSLRADFGSLDEDDNERGSARAAELLARAAIIASPAAATLRTLGVQPETDLQTGVGYEWCAFTLAVPATPPASTAVRAALESLSRAFAKPPAESLTPEAWANLRATLDERERAAMGTALRANTTLLPRLMPESRYATRFPMGPGSLDPALTIATADAFRSKWLVPSNAALVVAGDGLSLDELETLTRSVFARIPGGPRPARVPIGPVEAKQPTALVLHDPGLATDFIQLTRGLAPSAPGGANSGGIDSTERFLDDLAARVLFEIVSRRIDEAAPDAPGVRKAIMPRLSRFFTLSAVIAGGPAGSAPTLARALISTARDLQANPVSDAELNAAKAAVLSAFDAESRDEPSLSPEKAAEHYAEAMTLRDTPLSAPQRAELARTLIARVTPEAVIAAARHRLDLNHTALVALLPTPAADKPDASPLTEPALLAAFDTPAPPPQAEQPLAAGAAEAAALKAPSRGANAPAKPLPTVTDLLPKEAPADAVTTIELHPPSGVFTAGFANAAAFHHRAMHSSQGDDNTSPGNPTGRIVLTIAFGIGPADETPDTRSLSSIALAALKEPATAAISAADFRRLLDENSLSTDILLAADAVTLVINAPSDRAEAAFAIASAVASHGVLDRAVFDRARARFEAMALQGALTPEYAITDLSARAVFPHDPRVRAPTADDARAMDFAKASAFVRHVLTTSPLEAAVTGDIDRATAINLATRALATLPARAPLTINAAAVTLPVPSGPVEAVEPIDTADGRSVVFEGFRAADETETAAVTALDVGAEALSARLTTTLRERLRLSVNIRVENNPARGWRNAGDFRAVASCAAGRENELRAALRAALNELAAKPLDPNELASARQRVAARRAEELSDPQWWAARLVHTARRPIKLDDLLSAPARTLALSAEDVQNAVKRYATEQHRISLTITPR